MHFGSELKLTGHFNQNLFDKRKAAMIYGDCSYMESCEIIAIKFI
jgi:hypothetical protein